MLYSWGRSQSRGMHIWSLYDYLSIVVTCVIHLYNLQSKAPVAAIAGGVAGGVAVVIIGMCDDYKYPF